MRLPSNPTFVATRRRVLRALAGLPAVAMLSSVSGRALGDGLERRSITLVNTHTGERLTTDYSVGGSYRPQSLAELGWLLRDHRTGEAASMDCRLYDLLHELAALAGCEPCYEVISGYRSPRTNAALHARSGGVASHSLHMDGRAIDVRLTGCATDQLRDLALDVQHGGVGYYRKSDFLHLDTGRVRSWAG